MPRFEPATSRLQIRHSTTQPLEHLKSKHQWYALAGYRLTIAMLEVIGWRNGLNPQLRFQSHAGLWSHPDQKVRKWIEISWFQSSSIRSVLLCQIPCQMSKLDPGPYRISLAGIPNVLPIQICALCSLCGRHNAPPLASGYLINHRELSV